MNLQFKKGLRDGIPISLGYFSVAFGFGILCASVGLTPWEAVAISASNLTSAGQVAGVGVIAAGGSYLEMALTQLVINSRYSLMGLSLSQKLDDSFDTPNRLLISFSITDEIFAACNSKVERLNKWYMYGIIPISAFGWILGTYIGATAGQILPQALSDAMGIVLYGMFLAVIIPAARGNRGILAVICIAALLSILFQYVFTAVSSGFAIIICAILAAAVGAVLFPVHEAEDEEVEA